MAIKSKEAVAAAEFNSVIGGVYDFVPDAKWDGKSWTGSDGKALQNGSVIQWTRIPATEEVPRLKASDIKRSSKKNPLAPLFDTYPGMWGAVLVAMGVFCRTGYARVEGYADAIAKWLTENNIPFKLSIKDGKEYVVCSDKKMLSAALGCQ
jgi:hypothetical protein